MSYSTFRLQCIGLACHGCPINICWLIGRRNAIAATVQSLMEVSNGKGEIEDSFHLTYHLASKAGFADYHIPLGNIFKIVIGIHMLLDTVTISLI